ncbi:hypothetical protein [Cytobacillus purgationiresistens]|uniref:Phage gp6-like head-tail connector protein n=1 Tax=Cytobacillus purgationiresistens TaxID=863449 RepID=A0ABU0AHN6_9BACI|nr:hypothetical protein [Cytobacillus purgationiresistens]MDQ0269943.1 hypothetical protein [Cytobacillus purgationiresistens]
MKVIDIVKAKLPDPKPEDEILSMHIEEVGQSIQTYCNRGDIPPELRFVHANMVIDFINGIKRSNDSDGQTTISSIKEGDVQVSFGAARLESKERATQSLLFDYAKQLNRFRKLRW